MPAVTVVMHDKLCAEVDKIVAQRNLRNSAGPDKAVLAEAHKLAKTKGTAASNAYLKQHRAKRASRMGVINELVQRGLDAHNSDIGERLLSIKPARPKNPREPKPKVQPKAAPKEAPAAGPSNTKQAGG